MFSKENYWKNREAGKRGQGERPSMVAGVIEVTPPSSLRGLGLRKRASATKHSPFNTKSWAAHKAVVARKVAVREQVAKLRSAERRAKREVAA